MNEIFEISAAPHLPHTLRALGFGRASEGISGCDEQRSAEELLADALIVISAAA